MPVVSLQSLFFERELFTHNPGWCRSMQQRPKRAEIMIWASTNSGAFPTKNPTISTRPILGMARIALLMGCLRAEGYAAG